MGAPPALRYVDQALFGVAVNDVAVVCIGVTIVGEVQCHSHANLRTTTWNWPFWDKNNGTWAGAMP